MAKFGEAVGEGVGQRVTKWRANWVHGRQRGDADPTGGRWRGRTARRRTGSAARWKISAPPMGIASTMRGKHVRAIRNEKIDAGFPAAGNQRLRPCGRCFAGASRKRNAKAIHASACRSTATTATDTTRGPTSRWRSFARSIRSAASSASRLIWPPTLHAAARTWKGVISGHRIRPALQRQGVREQVQGVVPGCGPARLLHAHGAQAHRKPTRRGRRDAAPDRLGDRAHQPERDRALHRQGAPQAAGDGGIKRLK